MELTLSVLARVRTLFATGASVEDVYEALVAPRAADALRDSDALHARRTATGSSDVEVLVQEVSRLATLVDRLHAEPQGAVVPLGDAAPMPKPVEAREPVSAPPAVTRPAQAPPPAPSAAGPTPTPRPAEPPLAAERVPEARPKKPEPTPAATDDDGASALDLHDQIAVAVMRISMLMGDDDRRPAAAKPDVSRRRG